MGRQEDLYLDLMKKSLLNLIYGDPREMVCSTSGRSTTRAEARRTGLDWPARAHTMIGAVRLDSLQFCVEDVLRRNVPGDLIETGVWRGGASILMKAVLRAYGDTRRVVWVADSFMGCPPPNPEKYPHDQGIELNRFPELAVPRDEVEENFRRYGLLDKQVEFLEGWFRETLGDAPIERLALIRLDGDLYESTIDALTALYPRLSSGGYVIVDDYGAIPACRQATEDFRRMEGVTDPLHEVDWTAVYWTRS